MLMKQLAILAASMMLAGSASASVYTYGDMTDSAVATPIYITSAGAFTDQHFFSVSAPFALGTAVFSDIAFPPLLDIAGLYADIYIDGGVIGVVDGGDVLFAAIGAGDFFNNGGGLIAGDYYMQVGGAAVGTGFNIDTTTVDKEYGAYFFNAAVVAVPEAETWAMLLAGLGLVGMKLRRRAGSQSQI
jgi:hypothetical protein